MGLNQEYPNQSMTHGHPQGPGPFWEPWIPLRWTAFLVTEDQSFHQGKEISVLPSWSPKFIAFVGRNKKID